MQLFIGNLANNVRSSDLAWFFQRYLRKPDYEKAELFDSHGLHGSRRFAVVELDNPKRAREFIKKLHGKVLRSERVEVRELQYRSSNNDRRAVNWRNVDWDDQDRRGQDRRGQVIALGEVSLAEAV
jgi:RNA recognition motif-containing protein